jgi:hypothetical protein
VRILLLIAVILMAGCTAADEAEPDLFGSCPQWIAGASDFQATVNVTGLTRVAVNFTDAESDGLHYDGHPLDLLIVATEASGDVKMTAVGARGERLLIKTEEGESLPSASLGGQQEFRLFMSSVEHGSTPATGSVTLEFQGAGDVTLSVLPFYRVCGIMPETPAT